MAFSKSSAPTHLSIFVTDPDSGRPAMYLPLYAEVAAPRIMPVDIRFEDLIHPAFNRVDPEARRVHDRINQAAMQALSETIDPASRDALWEDQQMLFNLFYSVFKEILDTTQREHIADIRPADLKPLIAGALRRRAEEFGLVLEPENTEAIWANPLGVLTTDHVGYASFDLKRLHPDVYQLLVESIDARRNDPNAVLKLAIWVYPYGYDGRFDALSQARFAFDAVVARLPMRWHTLPPALINMGPRALQNPSLTDWRLSPASFAASPKTLVGEDGCEQLFPANLALQEFVLRQVVRVTGDPPDGLDIPEGYKFAYVDDYKVSWFSLGHSLGEILYSLPLAPAESVKLAVIDWSWDNLTTRDEQTRLTEDVLHRTHRDRTITETVKAGLKEFQHGYSLIGGTGNASGVSAGANIGVVGLGGAVGNTWSLGGSTATSEGSRELAAENIQRLSDSFSQSSSAQRELNSTVVIQARQEEKESIQTRTFTNYNHSHTMTILYYEVLRHFRVTVEWVRRRPAVLVNVQQKLNSQFDANQLLRQRYLLEPLLLDPKLNSAFDAAARIALALEKLQREMNKWMESTQTVDPGAKSFVKFIAQFTTTSDDTSEPIFVVLHLHDGQTFEFQFDGAGDVGTSPEFEKTLPVPIYWNQIRGIEVKLKDINDGGDWEVSNILITMSTAANERVNILADAATRLLDDAGGTTGLLPSIRPPLPTTTKIGPMPERVNFITAEDEVTVKSLLAHFNENRSYYNRVLMFATDPGAVAIEFESKVWNGGQYMAEHVEPTPLAVFGNYVAYPLAKGAPTSDTLIVDVAAALNGNEPVRRQWAVTKLGEMNQHDRQLVELASTKSERLITLPTRGVFAEGKLGHCNVSEEIDNTRFWKWEEHPIPFEAPGINPVTPIQPQPQQISATPTAFPQSLVNIVNPSPAPDPTGLSAALSLLATPNIFRDMSGRQEVADLLKKLTEEAVDIAEVANKAREIQAKYGTDLDKQQKDYDLGAAKANIELEKGKLELEKEKARQVTPSEAHDAIKQSESEMKKGNTTPEEHKQLTKTVLNNQKGVQPAALQTKPKKIQFDLKGWGDTPIIGKWRLDLDQRNTAVGFVIETETNANGKIIIDVSNEFNDNRYSVSITGEVLAGFGINAALRVYNLLLEFPPEKYKANDYLYVVLKATTDKFHTKASGSHEVTKNFAEHYGLSLDVAIKKIVTVTGEGGWTWDKGENKTAGREMEMDVYYYTGGFTVESTA